MTERRRANNVLLLFEACCSTLRITKSDAVGCSFSAGGMRIPGTILEQEFLPDDFMRQWVQNFTAILTLIKVCPAYCALPAAAETPMEGMHIFVTHGSACQ